MPEQTATLQQTMSMPLLTVAVCTHNPKDVVFRRVLDSLRGQTLNKEQWELLLVDNCSHNSLQSYIDISWHPKARFISEKQLGLTHARLRAIRETQSPLLVFVDDDNILQPDYLEAAWTFMSQHPQVGVVGPRIDGEFEVPVQGWMTPWLPFLAINSTRISKVVITDDPRESIAIPSGAGLCIRSILASQYADQISGDKLRLVLDRKGKILSSSGDTDIVFTVIDLGYQAGCNPAMRLTHYMFKERLKLSYLARLRRAGGMTSHVVRYLHGIYPATKNSFWLAEIWRFIYATPVNRDWRTYWLKLNGCIGKIKAERFCFSHCQSALAEGRRPISMRYDSVSETGRLANAMNQVLAVLASHRHPYAIYGTGKVGRELSQLIQQGGWRKPLVFVDDKATVETLDGIPIIKPSGLIQRGIEEVVLATTCFHDEMKASLRACGYDKMIHCLAPASNPKDAVQKDAEQLDDYEYGWKLNGAFLKRQAESLALVKEVLKKGSSLNEALSGFDGTQYSERIVEYAYVFQWLEKYADGKRLLDIGCVLNNEVVAPALKTFCRELWFCNPAMEPPKVEMPFFYHVARIDNALFEEQYFDLITCLSTIEHIGYDNSQYGGSGAIYNEPTDQPLLDTLAHVLRWLKPNGHFLISVPFGRRSLCRHRVTKKIAFQLFDNASMTKVVEWAQQHGAVVTVNVYQGGKDGWVHSDHPETCKIPYAHGFPCAGAVAILEGRKTDENNQAI